VAEVKAALARMAVEMARLSLSDTERAAAAMLREF